MRYYSVFPTVLDYCQKVIMSYEILLRCLPLWRQRWCANDVAVSLAYKPTRDAAVICRHRMYGTVSYYTFHDTLWKTTIRLQSGKFVITVGLFLQCVCTVTAMPPHSTFDVT